MGSHGKARQVLNEQLGPVRGTSSAAPLPPPRSPSRSSLGASKPEATEAALASAGRCEAAVGLPPWALPAPSIHDATVPAGASSYSTFRSDLPTVSGPSSSQLGPPAHEALDGLLSLDVLSICPNGSSGKSALAGARFARAPATHRPHSSIEPVTVWSPVNGPLASPMLSFGSCSDVVAAPTPSLPWSISSS